jgi:serine/threonine-protein kinase
VPPTPVPPPPTPVPTFVPPPPTPVPPTPVPPDLVTVPSVIGMISGDADNTISAAGLVYQMQWGGTNCARYTVVEQSPPAGSKVAAGSAVTVYVCQPVTVPSVVGMDKSTAYSTLQSAGLRPTYAERTCDGNKPGGQVWATEPGPGAEVNPGSAVTIFYYEGCGGGTGGDNGDPGPNPPDP